MPLQLPVLDDRRFADLAAEGRGLVPTFAPEWTNHNPSDPGITLVELFAHLAEMLIYRLDRVTTANIAVFLNLLDGKARTAEDLQGKDVAAEIRATVQALRKLDRAVTAADFETLALEANASLPPSAPARVERARAVPDRNLLVDLEREKAGHVSVIVLPTGTGVTPPSDLTEAVKLYLEPRVLLTTRVHVLGPAAVKVGVNVTVVPVPDRTKVEERAQVAVRVEAAVKGFLDPHTGGEDGRGWPFGRNVFVSELYALLDDLDEVDYVTALSLTPTPADRLVIDRQSGQVVGVDVRPHELVQPDVITAVAVAPS